MGLHVHARVWKTYLPAWIPVTHLVIIGGGEASLLAGECIGDQ